MAEVGGDFDYNDPSSSQPNDYDVYDDDDVVQKKPLDTTQPFGPGQTSTPHHGGVQIEMQKMQKEQSWGLPSYAETSFGGDESTHLIGGLKENSSTGLLDLSKGIPDLNFDFLQEVKEEQIKRAKIFLKNRYPRFNEKDLLIGFSKKKPLMLVSKGPRGGETPIFLADGSDFQQDFLNKTYVKKALGTPAESLIKKTSDNIREKQKKLNESRQNEKLYLEEKEKKEKEELDLQRRIRAEEEKSQQLQDDPGADKNLLKQKETLLKNLKKDLKTKQKENEQLQKNYEDSQNKSQQIGQIQKSLLEEEEKRDFLERRLNSTRSFDTLKEQESHLIRLNEEDQAIINDENALSFDKEAAEERVAARNEELARLQTQIAEREEAMPLRERVKEIFKKNGVTVTAIFIAAGVTIGAVINAITKGLKATGKAMAGGLKEIASKLASLLPGLIGQIASFLFNTAAKAVGFLAEHTWLLILAAVAFVFEKYIKKRH